MTFEELLDQAIALLQRRGRLTYRALKRQFDLDDSYLEDLKAELIQGQRLAVDEEGEVLVWTGDAAASALPANASIAPALPGQDAMTVPDTFRPSPSTTANIPTLPSLAGERRQVTVLFADISGFTALAETLDPEDVRQVMNACFVRLVPLVEAYGGTIDKFIGDAIMALFGAPIAYDHAAERAVRTALAMIDALAAFNAEQGTALGLHCGLNTGLVIAGGIGTQAHQAYSVMGDAVNLAARLEDAAPRGQIFVGPETYHLTQAQFTFERLDPLRVQGKAEPVQVYRVLGLREGEPERDDGAPHGLTPLVGREAELTLLLDRWAQVTEGRGHVVVLSGEAGIGKSRLVQALKDHIAAEPHIRWECRCSPYYQHTAFYPLIDLLERALHFTREEPPASKVAKVHAALAPYRLAVDDTVPLMATLLGLPLPAAPSPQRPLTPHQQKQQTLEVLLALLLQRTEQHPVLFIVEDLHWSDPSTLEFLDLLIAQGPTARLLTLLTCRPEFQPSWGLRTVLTPIALQRLTRPQVEAMVERLTQGKRLPPEVLQHVVTKTDGVPLFVEELTKMVLESGLLHETPHQYELRSAFPAGAIPTTLQDSLMARLDRLAPVKALAQLGATIGRTFSYALLQAVAAPDEATLHHSLQQLVEAELLTLSGLPPRHTRHMERSLRRSVWPTPDTHLTAACLCAYARIGASPAPGRLREG